MPGLSRVPSPLAPATPTPQTQSGKQFRRCTTRLERFFVLRTARSNSTRAVAPPVVPATEPPKHNQASISRDGGVMMMLMMCFGHDKNDDDDADDDDDDVFWSRKEFAPQRPMMMMMMMMCFCFRHRIRTAPRNWTAASNYTAAERAATLTCIIRRSIS